MVLINVFLKRNRIEVPWIWLKTCFQNEQIGGWLSSLHTDATEIGLLSLLGAADLEPFETVSPFIGAILNRSYSNFNEPPATEMFTKYCDSYETFIEEGWI